jgi:hypothetical protein
METIVITFLIVAAIITVMGVMLEWLGKQAANVRKGGRHGRR